MGLHQELKPNITLRAKATHRIKTAALVLAGVLFLGAPTGLSALDVPPLTGRVVDNANMIGSSAKQQITAYLQSVEESTGAQIAVLTVPSLEGDALEDFSIRVVDQWKLGGADRDNGVLLLVAAAEKKIRLEVGYGLEGVLTDAKSGLIIREVLQPWFQRGDFERGISEAVQVIGQVAAGDPDALPAVSAAAGGSSAGQAIGELLFTGFIVFLVMGVGAFGRRRRYGGFWQAMFLGSLLGGGRRSGSSRYRGSGFGGGGFGGGGFSGGGGGFGGGGASGGW
ncbi:MAG: TPM domain-containing protein [Alkalispirochaeta sp.]